MRSREDGWWAGRPGLAPTPLAEKGPGISQRAVPTGSLGHVCGKPPLSCSVNTWDFTKLNVSPSISPPAVLYPSVP